MPKTFVDIESVVKNWAWRLYDKTATRKQRSLRDKERRKNQSYIGINIDWSDVKFRDETEWSTLVDEAFEDAAAKDVPSTTAQKQLPAKTARSDVSVLFQTKFTNNTCDDQEYSMRTEKTTRSACSTTIENGITKGFELGISLKTPCEVFEANAGYHREVSLTNTDGETFEEELTWGVESSIKVKSGHMAEAQLYVVEKKQSGDFVVSTYITGTVYVTFTNIRDNNSFLKASGGDIVPIIEQYLEQERRKGESLDFITISGDTVTVKTKGTCKFRYGVEQEVTVNQRALRDIP